MSNDKTRIRFALDELERIQAEIGRVVSRTDDRKRHDLIDCRRRLAVQIAEVNNLAEQWLAKLHRPDLLQAYRDRFSKMRSASAMHQAHWPAVRLTTKTPEYEASAATLRSANHEFIHWVRATLDQF